MKNSRSILLAVLTVALLGFALWFFFSGTGTKKSDDLEGTASNTNTNSGENSLLGGNKSDEEAGVSSPPSLLDGDSAGVTRHPILEELITEIRDGFGDEAAILESKAALREKLKGLGRERAAEVLAAALEQFTETPTGLNFSVDAKGFLATPPTVEGMLIDELSFWDPETGASVAREWLESSETPYVHRLSALHSYVYGNGLGYNTAREDRFFVDQLSGLMEDFESGDAVSGPDLAVFDLVTFANQRDLGDQLVELAAGGSGRDYQSGVSNASDAAFFALDRIVTNNFQENMSALQSGRQWSNLKGTDKVMLFTRADARDPEGSQLLTDFILSPDRTTEERRLFIDNFPNANYYEGNTIIPLLPGRSDSAVSSLDRASLNLARSWKEQPFYADNSEFIDTLISQLESYLP